MDEVEELLKKIEDENEKKRVAEWITIADSLEALIDANIDVLLKDAMEKGVLEIVLERINSLKTTPRWCWWNRIHLFESILNAVYPEILERIEKGLKEEDAQK